MICSRCMIDKVDAEFTLNLHTGRRKEYCISCARIIRAEKKHLAYALRENKNPDTCHRRWIPLTPAEKTLTFYQRNIEKCKTWQQERRERDLERIRAHDRQRYHENKEGEKIRKRRYLEMYPHKIIERNMRRRTAKTRARPTWLTAIQKAQIQEFYEIARAKSVQTGIKHHVDHMFALRHPKFNGLHVPWNLQVLTQTENYTKKLRVPKQFAEMLWDNI
jgi:hypothetical protein